MNSNWSYSPETPSSGQFYDFFTPVTLKFDRWPWKTIGYLLFATSSFVHHFVYIGEFNLVLQSRMPNWGQNWQLFLALCWVLTCDLDLWPLTLTFCIDITFFIGNNAWNFNDDTMTRTLWRRCDRQTDRRTDGRTDWSVLRAAWLQLKSVFQSKI